MIPRDEWGGIYGFDDLGWHIKNAMMCMRLNMYLKKKGIEQ